MVVLIHAPFQKPKGEWATLLRTLGADAPSSPTSLSAVGGLHDAKQQHAMHVQDNNGGEEIMTCLGPKKLSQHAKELGRGDAGGCLSTLRHLLDLRLNSGEYAYF